MATTSLVPNSRKWQGFVPSIDALNGNLTAIATQLSFSVTPGHLHIYCNRVINDKASVPGMMVLQGIKTTSATQL